jgi:hypothetical protein
MKSQENLIKSSRDIYIKDIRAIKDDIKNLVEFRGYDDVFLDFSECQTIFADSMVSLIPYIIRYKDDGVSFQLKLPKFEKLSRLFLNCGWANAIDAKNHSSPGADIWRNLCLTQLHDGDGQNRIVDQSIGKILGVTTWLDREHLRALEWSLSEITDNVLQHAFSASGGFIQISIHEKSREIEFVVSDAGIGIPNSLRSGYEADLSDQDALEHAVKEGVTRGTGQGNGLFGTFQISYLSDAPFYINSGRAYLIRDRSKKVSVKSDDLDFHGTSVVCYFNFSKPLILEKALNLNGKPFLPIDIIESNFIDTDEYDKNKTIIFCLSKENQSFGNRYAGLECRRKIQNIAKMAQATHVVLDFSDLDPSGNLWRRRAERDSVRWRGQ